ncbi:hypothetical protein N7539_006796 [Penicillium diatomitis]|uniref:Uncharacterized protein n=1 Tax=Penicillium diatomitis TaxID=2819901 RepID=A0A9W9X2D8_9EURO|nr:uncharacterized protein N7539_006796 [Penicillium diatomitis]KAJ5480902.1 hypothetical protein N7539_006796 [Penicillium diatomitis]
MACLIMTVDFVPDKRQPACQTGRKKCLTAATAGGHPMDMPSGKKDYAATRTSTANCELLTIYLDLRWRRYMIHESFFFFFVIRYKSLGTLNPNPPIWKTLSSGLGCGQKTRELESSPRSPPETRFPTISYISKGDLSPSYLQSQVIVKTAAYSGETVVALESGRCFNSLTPQTWATFNHVQWSTVPAHGFLQPGIHESRSLCSMRLPFSVPTCFWIVSPVTTTTTTIHQANSSMICAGNSPPVFLILPQTKANGSFASDWLKLQPQAASLAAPNTEPRPNDNVGSPCRDDPMWLAWGPRFEGIGRKSVQVSKPPESLITHHPQPRSTPVHLNGPEIEGGGGSPPARDDSLTLQRTRRSSLPDPSELLLHM